MGLVPLDLQICSLIYFFIFHILFNQVGQLRTILIYNLAKIKQSSATKTTTQSYTWDKQTYSQ